MRRFFLIALFLSSGFLQSECFAFGRKPLQKSESKEVILTYPKSGTNLTIGTLQILTRKPVNAFEEGVTNRLNLKLDYAKTPLWRAHETRFIRNLNPNTSKLLLVLRNYKECIVRNEKQSSNRNFSAAQLRNWVVNNTAGFSWYMDNLTYFDAWSNPDTKLLIYYEDLISKPEVVIPKILTFFGENTADLQNFFAEYDSWKIKILNSYKEQHGANLSSGGNQEIFHSKDFPIKILKEIDTTIQQRYPELWTKYLKRYETVESKPNSSSLF